MALTPASYLTGRSQVQALMLSFFTFSKGHVSSDKEFLFLVECVSEIKGHEWTLRSKLVGKRASLCLSVSPQHVRCCPLDASAATAVLVKVRDYFKQLV